MAKVAFIQNIWSEWLGVMGLSALLKQRGHQVDVFIGNDRTIMRGLEDYGPDIIAVSAMNIQHEWLSRITQVLRANHFKPPIIVGGPHPTFAPEQVISLPAVDVICRGEGEGAMVEFADAVAGGHDYSAIPNLWVKKRRPEGAASAAPEIKRNPVRPLIMDLDSLPFADRDLYRGYKYFHDKPFESFLAGRGCPYDCTFCFNHQFRELYSASRDRRRTARNVIDEIKAVHSRKPVRIVWFMDSTFNLNREWFLSFCDLFARESDLGMTCNVRLHLLDDDMVRAMAKARCRSARFAIESGNEALRNRVLKKVLKDEDIVTGAELFRKHGVPFATANMMGLPEETLAMAWETILINRRIQPMFVDMGLFMPYPNLEITEYAKRQGCLSAEGLEDMAHGRKKMLSSVLKQKEIKEVCNLHKFFYLLVRHPWLDPIARKLVHVPENRIFDMIFGASYIVENCRRTDIPYSYGRMFLNAMKNFAQIS